MIFGRVGQGFTGGALIPTAQTIVATRLNRRQMPIGMTLFGLIVILGPLVGPVLGGLLTENSTWRWCFFLNVPVFFGLAALLLLGLHYASPRLEMLKRGRLERHTRHDRVPELPHHRAGRRSARALV